MTASAVARANVSPAPELPSIQESDSLPSLPARFHLTPEFQLLLACCSTPTLHGQTIASLCSKDIDWGAFTSLVTRHQVTALVYDALCQHAIVHVPSQLKEDLKQRTLSVRAHALHHAAELVRLNQAFADAGIEVISLKGVTLSLRLFGDPAMRHVQDTDLMVKAKDLDRADALLRARGYRRTSPAADLTPKMWQRMLLQDHHLSYSHDELRLVVELHWGLDLWLPANVSELWDHNQQTNWMGTTFRVLDDDAVLLVLCSHGAGHRWSRLKWLSDVAPLLEQERSGEWNDLFAMAARFDLELALGQAAMLAHWLFGTRLADPLGALARREKSSGDLACRALQVVLADKKRLVTQERYGILTSLRYALRLRRNLPLHVYMRKVWISSAYFSDFPLPDSMFWLYYPLRPWLWLWNQYARARGRRA
jgi:Uncharacterised nucleotidyltransferase